MKLRNLLWKAAPRLAAGIDVSPAAVRLVVASRRRSAQVPVQIEYACQWPLAAGVMARAEIVDRHAVVQALRGLFAGLPPAVATGLTQCAMAVPDSATITASLPLGRLQARAANGLTHAATMSALEPAVMMEAERIAGVERHALAVDWFIEDKPSCVGEVTIAATARHHLEARVECAAAAGITLTAVDAEPHAALRALRYAARIELAPRAPYALLWIGEEAVFGWRLADEIVVDEMRYPAPEHDCLADALRDLAEGGAIDCTLVGGELELLEGVNLTLADIGDVLGCTVLPFECAALGCGQLTEQAVRDEPAFAVALGLALRGVME
jgi:Tfp pilus assembly PilM family ATPase